MLAILPTDNVCIQLIYMYMYICMHRFRHGFAFHMEVSFMEAVARSILSKQCEVGDEKNPESAVTESKVISTGSNKERIKRKCHQLLSRIEEIPSNVSCLTYTIFQIVLFSCVHTVYYM
jgi:hypothetical protein